MNRVFVVQARMTSSRLPGKILMDVAGRPMLARQIDRVRMCKSCDRIVLATTTNATDDPVAALGEQLGVSIFRGSEHDVLTRYLGAARRFDADIVVRLTGDCPLIDPEITDQVVDAVSTNACDYASNVLRRTYPRGLDTEAMHRDTLERVARLATSPAAREHVTYFITTERPDLFILRGIEDAADNSDLRWTVDTADDLSAIRRIFDEARLGEAFLRYHALIAWVRAHPDIAGANRHIQQKAQ
jgi:spore coat polysaccharide biosynthesis protein SpsF